MATQTIEFGAPDGLTITAKLFAAGSDTVVATLSSVTEATNRDGVYSGTTTDIAAGEYRLIATSDGVKVADWWVTLTLATATFQCYDFSGVQVMAANVLTASALATDAVTEIAAAISGGTESDLLQSTTIATLTSQTVFTLTAGSADSDAYVDQIVIISDAVTAVQKAVKSCYSYVGSTKTLRLESAPAFTIAVGDTVKIMAHANTAATLQSVTVTPVLGVVTERVSETNITSYVGEDYPATITTLDSAGASVDPSTWSTIQIVIEDRRGTELLTIAHASITTTSTQITFTIPAATVNIEPSVHKWACRSISGNIVRLEGNINVKYAADD